MKKRKRYYKYKKFIKTPIVKMLFRHTDFQKPRWWCG